MASRSEWTGFAISKDFAPNYDTANILSQSWGNSASAKATASYTSGIFGDTGLVKRSDVTGFANAYSKEGSNLLSNLSGAGYNPLNLTGFNLAQSFFGGGGGKSTGWTFITTPGDISWTTDAAVERQTVYGTNTAPVVVGSKGMRDLEIRDALVEGFSRLRVIEDNIVSLENLQNFTLDGAKGFVNVPVYQVWANSKRYGFANGKDGGYFVIKSISVKESMRDLNGNATRATVDVSFTQVPAYQVGSGRDLASKALAGASSILGSVGTAANQGIGGTATGVAKAASGASAPSVTGVGSTNNPTATAPPAATLAPISITRYQQQNP